MRLKKLPKEKIVYGEMKNVNKRAVTASKADSVHRRIPNKRLISKVLNNGI
jgi:hypothetical protein